MKIELPQSIELKKQSGFVIDEFYTLHLKPEGLNTLGVYKKQLDSIKAHQSLE